MKKSNTSKNDRSELGRQYSPMDLHRGLQASEKVVYSENGNRAVKAKTFLKRLEAILPRLGVTRVADISYLASSGYPVFQSCRPNVWHHTRLGQNTGAQGKGPSTDQAKISCIMETVEGYCAEQRSPDLIRGSFDFLKNQHAIVSPDQFVQAAKKRATLDEPLMWSHAYSVRHKCSVLIPAETIYFPFIAPEYETTSYFIGSSNGLASGCTYLEAAVHGLYEVIERYYTYMFEEGKVSFEALHEEELLNAGLSELANSPNEEFEIQLCACEIPGIRNLPVIGCTLLLDGVAYQGWGCSATVQISLDRAISEALQSLATQISGSREDMDTPDRPAAQDELSRGSISFRKTKQPERRTLRVHEFQSRVADYEFDSLQTEYKFILKWLREIGFNEVYLANLTRIGIDIPVVKAIIPDMESENGLKNVTRHGYADMVKCRFPSIHYEKANMLAESP